MVRRALAVAAISLWAAAARAEPPAPPPEERAPAARGPSAEGALGRVGPAQPPSEDGSWFVATRTDVGFPYARPRLSVGFGDPFRRWIGLDVNPVLSLLQVAAYGGVRFALPHADLRLGARYVYPIEDRYLSPREGYTRAQLEAETFERGTYWAPEAELSWQTPGTRAVGFGEISGKAIRGVPEPFNVYEQRDRVIVDPPFMTRARVGVGPYVGARRIALIAAAAEVIWLPGRDDYIVRGGMLLRIRLSSTLEIRASYLPALRSPDALGLRGGDFAHLGIRHLWSKRLR